MNHKWQNNPDFIKNNGFVSEDTCKTCGCTRRKHVYKMNGHVSSYYMYDRSGITYGFDRPDCLDWNDNTLD